jgi:hypothetical protein
MNRPSRRQLREVAYLIAFAVSTHAASVGASEQAVVRKLGDRDIEVGQALIAHARSRCLALLPTHVLQEAHPAGLRAAGTTVVRLGEVDQSADLGDDLSITILSGGITEDCGRGLGTYSRAVESRLAAGSQGTLRIINADGTLGFVPAAWVDHDGELFIRVVPVVDTAPFRKGMSGSLLLASDGVPVGMLLSVHARTGVGTVMRIDKILARAERFIEAQAESAASPADSTNSPQDHSLVRARLLSWSMEPADGQHRAQNLLEDADSPLPAWITVPTSQPITLDIALESAIALTGVALDLSGVPPAQLPSGLQVLARSTHASARMANIWSGHLPPLSDESQVTLTFAPKTVAAARLVLFPPAAQHGKPQPLSIRRIRFIGHGLLESH